MDVILSDREVLLFLLKVLEYELVVEQFFDIRSIVRVFGEALVEEISCLLADVGVGGDTDLILDYLDQIFLFADFKGVLPNQHLIGHDA